MAVNILFFPINQGGLEDVHGRFIPEAQILKVDGQEVTNNITGEASSNEHKQQASNHVPFTPHDNTKHDKMNNLDRREVMASDGPDSTCLEIGNGI